MPPTRPASRGAAPKIPRRKRTAPKTSRWLTHVRAHRAVYGGSFRDALKAASVTYGSTQGSLFGRTFQPRDGISEMKRDGRYTDTFDASQMVQVITPDNPHEELAAGVPVGMHMYRGDELFYTNEMTLYKEIVHSDKDARSNKIYVKIGTMPSDEAYVVLKHSYRGLSIMTKTRYLTPIRVYLFTPQISQSPNTNSM